MAPRRAHLRERGRRGGNRRLVAIIVVIYLIAR